MPVITCEGGCGVYTDKYVIFTSRDAEGRIVPLRLCEGICAPIERRRRAKAAGQGGSASDHSLYRVHNPTW
jgi:hypothetical protein